MASSSNLSDMTLRVVRDGVSEQEVFLQQGLSLGRNPSNTISIDDPEIDRIHSQVLRRADGTMVLECQGEHSAVLLGDGTSTRSLVLIEGATFMIGKTTIQCHRRRTGTAVLVTDNPWAVRCPFCHVSLVDQPKRRSHCPTCSREIVYFQSVPGGLGKTPDQEIGFEGWLPQKVGPYFIRAFVAQGGMGIVLRGLHKTEDLPSAVKLMCQGRGAKHAADLRFAAEIETLKSLKHPNVVRLQEHGTEDHLPWLSMDWVNGNPLSRLINVATKAQRPVKIERVQELLMQVLAGLGYLHGKEIVHRDLKPSNILVAKDGLVKLADFGIAKQTMGKPSVTMLTQTGVVAGTEAYMAPEQAAGDRASAASDIFSFGMIWYELLTGHRAIGIIDASGLRWDGAPAAWPPIITRCLSPNPSMRPSLQEIVDGLEKRNRVDAPSLPLNASHVSQSTVRTFDSDSGSLEEAAVELLNRPDAELETSARLLPRPHRPPPRRISTWRGIQRLALWHRMLNWSIVVSLIMTALYETSGSPLALISTAAFTVIVVIETADALRLPFPAAWSWMSAIPILWFIPMGIVSFKGTRELRRAGLHVGFTGCKAPPEPPPPVRDFYSKSEAVQRRTRRRLIQYTISCIPLFLLWIVLPWVGSPTHPSNFDNGTSSTSGGSIATKTDPSQQLQQGLAYLNGNGVNKDEVKGFALVKEAADQGYAAAQYNLGSIYQNGRGVANDDVEAVAWYRKAADQGLADAQNDLGFMYSQGQGVVKDDVEAVAWFRKAAARGNAQAQTNLGIMYQNGQGVGQDDAQAMNWYRKAADAGNAEAMAYIGMLYENGQGVTVDIAQAIQWYRPAANAGNVYAMYRLGWFYENGESVDQNYVEAIRWYRPAANAGNAYAMCRLGLMYENGQGVAKDDVEAVAWYRKSAAAGDNQAKYRLFDLGQK